MQCSYFRELPEGSWKFWEFCREAMVHEVIDGSHASSPVEAEKIFHTSELQIYCSAQVTKGPSASVVQHQSMQSQSIRVAVQAICKILLRVALPAILVDLLSPMKFWAQACGDYV